MRFEVSMTPAEWKQSLAESVGCPGCGCMLVEIDEDDRALCARCGKPWQPAAQSKEGM